MINFLWGDQEGFSVKVMAAGFKNMRRRLPGSQHIGWQVGISERHRWWRERTVPWSRLWSCKGEVSGARQTMTRLKREIEAR